MPLKSCHFPSATTFHFMAIIQKISVPFGVSFDFFILEALYFLLHQDKEMNALDQLRKRPNKRKARLRKKEKKKKRAIKN
jgi:hypothetical protein